jgi:hypothetical protein
LALDRPGRKHILKSHDVDSSQDLISRRADVIIISIRDPRDAVTSAMLYQDRPFGGALPLVEK